MNKNLMLLCILLGLILSLLPYIVKFMLFTGLFIYLYWEFDEYDYQFTKQKENMNHE